MRYSKQRIESKFLKLLGRLPTSNELESCYNCLNLNDKVAEITGIKSSKGAIIISGAHCKSCDVS